MLSSPTTCLDQNETLAVTNFAFVQVPLPRVLRNKVIALAIKEFKCRENLGKVLSRLHEKVGELGEIRKG